MAKWIKALWEAVPLWEEIFQSRVLTNEQFLQWGIFVSLIFVVYCFLAHRMILDPKIQDVKAKEKQTKRLSWMISLLNSVVMTSFGLYYAVKTFPRFPQVRSFDTATGRQVFHHLTDSNILVAIWFSIANISDILFGLMCYAKYLDPLTAWVHHSIYIWIMIVSTTGNGGFTTCNPFAPSFSLMLLEELPTAILALGHVFPSLRSDWGFGSTFFLLRLCYHVYMAIYAFFSGVDTIVTVLFFLTTVMHSYWFYGWIVMMMKGSKKTKKITQEKSD